MNNVPAILRLSDGRTYGRSLNGKKSLYRCETLSCDAEGNPKRQLLVPYEIDKSSFHKLLIDKYVMVRTNDDAGGHASQSGVIVATYGNVNDFRAFCEFQLRRRALNTTGQKEFISRVRALSAPPMTPPLSIDRYVFTIDAPGAEDFDDAFSVDAMSATMATATISVYITNVARVMDKYHLWSYLTDRTSNVYLPPPMGRLPMLPARLTDQYMSLKKGESRECVRFQFDCCGADITEMRVYPVVNVVVDENMKYTDHARLSDCADFQKLLNVTQCLSTTTISAADEVVCFWMVETNRRIANYMLAYPDAACIVRGAGDIIGAAVGGNHPNDLLDAETKNILYAWKYSPQLSAGKFSVRVSSRADADIDAATYMPVTSPMRRMIDLLNVISVTYHVGGGSSVDESCVLSQECMAVLRDWTMGAGRMQFLNKSLRDVQKTQLDCRTLYTVLQKQQNAADNNEYDGVVMDVNENEYTVYIRELRLVSRIKGAGEGEGAVAVMPLDRVRVRVFVFHDKSTLTQKIRLCFV